MFSLFSTADIRRIRDESLGNLETLILAVTSRLIVLRNHEEFGDPELAPKRDILNCVRILTRLLPYVYEAEYLESWEDNFFWSVRRKRIRPPNQEGQEADVLFDGAATEPVDTTQGNEGDFAEVKPLAEELIDALLDLLFYTDFTLPKIMSEKPKVVFSIWQSGVGCNTAVGTSAEIESRRMEVLRLLLTLTSKSMYTSASE